MEADTREDSNSEEVTHGLCLKCSHHIFAQLGMPLRQYLDGMDVPVAIVDSDAVVLMANRAAAEMVTKAAEQIEGVLCGKVFECEHGITQEGCGRTVHCSGCAIRNSIRRTIESGEPQVRVPATLRCVKPGETTETELLISTELLDGLVLLRIEKP
jgi:PAS domain-containing protein